MGNGNSYLLHPAYLQAQAKKEEYQNRAKDLVKARPRDVVKEALFVAEVAGASYVASRVAGGGGPEGKKILNAGIELWAGALIGGAGLVLIGHGHLSRSGLSEKAEEAAEHLLALGAGCIAAYTARLGFEAGLANAKPPAEEQANENQVSGAPPQVTCYYLPAPAPWAVAPGAPQMQMQMLPAAVPMEAQPEQLAPAVVQEKQAIRPVVVEASAIGADEIDSAVQILERINQR
jgi:hypothetical protein